MEPKRHSTKLRAHACCSLHAVPVGLNPKTTKAVAGVLGVLGVIDTSIKTLEQRHAAIFADAFKQLVELAERNDVFVTNARLVGFVPRRPGEER